ncbi:kinesin-like protein KIF11-B [Ptychodera flava]|uniref:kinesin-like protein KIF11-B n=1 Tax=Ptychodera flava TaxID=63121 RepID=UPI003969C75B
MASFHKPGKNPKEKPRETNVQVAVRCRPLNEQEKSQQTVISVNDKKNQVNVGCDIPGKSFKKTFSFDKVFGPHAKQIDVYKSVVVPIVDEVLQGYNCTIFAYGQTGTGKTFTMEGERSADTSIAWDEDPLAGIIPRTLHQLFETLQRMNVEFSVRVSFLEIYQEELFDLLGDGDSKLRMYEDNVKKGSVVISGLEERPVHDKNEVFHILEIGWKKRQTAATKMNDHSSRSHAVFTILVHIKEVANDGEEMVKCGKLYLVDLAGSENIGRSGAVDRRAKEAGNINQSLLTLGRVITSLTEHAPHIPYRESKLTRLLQDSLGGSTKTSIIATVSPAHCNIEESLSTLDYAHRARNITNRPEVNQKMTKRALIKQYTEEIERLRLDLHAAREKDGFFVSKETYHAMEAQITCQSQTVEDLNSKIVAMGDEIKKITDLFQDTKNELEATSEKLATTEVHLEDTSARLYQTRQNLKETIIERDQKQHLMEAHADTENCLYNQATKLLSTTTAGLHDLTGVHDKLDRKQAVEEHNVSEQTRFKQVVSANFRKMQQNTTSNCDKQVQWLTNHQAGLDQFFSEVFRSMSTLGTNIASMSRSVQDQCQHLTGNTSEDNDENNSHSLEGLLNGVTEYMGSVVKTLSALTKTMQAEQAQYQDQVSARVQETQHFQQQTQGQLQELTEELKSQEEKCKVVAHNYHEKCEQQMKEQRQYQTQTMTMVDALANQLAELRNVIQDSQSKSESQHSQHTSAMNKVMQCVSTMTDNTVQQKDTIHTTIGQFSANHMQALNSTSNQLGDDFSKNIGMVDSASSGCLDMTAEVKTHVEIQTQTLTNISTAIETQTAEQVKSIDTVKERIKAKNDTVTDLVMNQASGVKLWSEFMKGQLENRSNDVSKFLEEDLKKDIPTGNTPVRRPFHYPKDFKKTEPHDMLICNFMETYQIPFEDEDEENTMSQEPATQPESVADTVSNASLDVDEAMEVELSSDNEKENSDTESVCSERSNGGIHGKLIAQSSKIPTPSRSRLPLRVPNSSS